ncbi:uncharacterized protein LOC123663932 [Melitaea cinxia]|uniref:uncharacterized protein LOC123663932 n=1 Tax=Melitaea cinxia TaxID=113334 RepID=UPI001E272A2C|nr:uncharacterized protein LOC123663932 [Melitaea cinxia]
MAKTHLTPKKIHSTKKAPRKVALNTATMRDKNLCKELENLMKEELSSEILDGAACAEDMWQVTKRRSCRIIHIQGSESKRTQEVALHPEALTTLTPRPPVTELDDPPTGEEFLLAIRNLTLSKSTGPDNLPAELVRLGCVSSPLYVLLQRCWYEEAIPQDMKDSEIVTLYKGKGDRDECNNYRGISLLNIAGKAFAKVVLRRLDMLAARIYPKTQCGFRTGRSTTDMIFTLRQLQEKCREHQGWAVRGTKQNRVPSKAFKHHTTTSCHDNMRGSDIFDGERSTPFDVNRGVRQGCVLAPTLFGIFLSALLLTAFEGCSAGVHLHTRKDGRSYNINLLKSENKRLDLVARELLYGGDAALVANSESELQELVTRYGNTCHLFSMSINTKKTVIMVQDVSQPPEITLDGTILDVVEHYYYLGSTTTSSLSSDRKIDVRIDRALTAFGLDTDHFLVIARMRDLFKWWQHRRVEPTSVLDRVKVENLQEKNDEYVEKLKESFKGIEEIGVIEDLWETFKEGVVNVAIECKLSTADYLLCNDVSASSNSYFSDMQPTSMSLMVLSNALKLVSCFRKRLRKFKLKVDPESSS